MRIEKNVKLYYLYSTFAELLILGPILVLFLTAKGLSFTEIMLLQSISSISVFFFEVPTGAVADKLGRKYSILIGASLWALGLLFYVIGKSFFVFALSEITFSLGSAFKSGADTALIYDSLKMLKREKEFQMIEGKARSYSLYAQALGSVLSSFLYEKNVNLPLIVSIIFMLVTIAIVLTFKEPEVEGKEGRFGINYFKHIKESGKYILNHDKLKAIVFFSMIFFVFYRTGFWYFQPYMEGVNIPVKYFGVIFFIFNITAAFISKRSSYIMEKTKPKTLTFMSALMIVSFLILGKVRAWPGVFAILLQQAARGIYGPVTTKYLNKHIPSDKRSTILSFQSLCTNLAVAIAFPFMGILKDHSDIFTTHLILSAAMIILTFISIKYMDGKLGVGKVVNKASL
ncbi:MFS transporter [Candidatus Clostridium radicumherbarum]|uniref:MFS transporter n=1 Tax=Candidatus Clostridium radicumherbarum TaxID=3381662 RepID=A0ABW8TN42_9CLOT